MGADGAGAIGAPVEALRSVTAAGFFAFGSFRDSAAAAASLSLSFDLVSSAKVDVETRKRAVKNIIAAGVPNLIPPPDFKYIEPRLAQR
jgi:hypothetical protein